MPVDARTRYLTPAPGLRARATLPAPGTSLGPYRLDAVIGSGGMGTVYRGWDCALDRPAAIKLLHPGIAWQEPGILQREGQALARLQHPNIATFYAADSVQGLRYLAMELVQGEPLARALERGPLGIEPLLQLAQGLLWALAHAHAAGVLHRDIKPANILLRPDGQPVLLDFGIATLLRGGAAEPRGDAGAGLVHGTPGYIAPEVLQGGPASPRSDLYQAALVLLEAATADTAAPGDSVEECARAILDGHPARLAPALPEPLRGIVLQALEAQPSRRPEDAAAMLFTLGSSGAPALRGGKAEKPGSEYIFLPARGRKHDALAGKCTLTPVSSDEAVPAHHGAPIAADAADLCARAERAFRTGGKDGLTEAEACYRQVLARDPGHVAALAGLSGAMAMRFPYTTDRATLEEAAALARQALRLDATALPARTWLVYALMRLGDADAGAREAEGADSTDPAAARCIYFGACCHVQAGRHARALALLLATLRLDPQSCWSRIVASWCQLLLGDEDQALSLLEEAERLERIPAPHRTSGCGAFVAELLRRRGALEPARETARAALARIEQSDFFYRDTHRAYALVVLGRIAQDQGDAVTAASLFQQAVAGLEGRPHALAGGHLMVHALAGLARASGDAGPLRQAQALLGQQTPPWNFEWCWGCSPELSAAAVAEAARDLDPAP